MRPVRCVLRVPLGREQTFLGPGAATLPHGIEERQPLYPRPVSGGERLCWKTGKSTYKQWKARGQILVHVPLEAVLPLANTEKRT